ncbi:amino acid permease-domain-containing protein, partial [Coemansia spiralis]
MRPDLAAAAITSDAPRKLGTWDGVFMPVMLSIWGILVYVRMGYFLSQVGILGTIGGFGCGYLVTTMTTLSISAISTNGTVKGGGPYYMLSRSLGPEFGGSIGLMFYAGTMLAGALNAVAFVEPLMSNLGQATGDMARVLPEGQRWHIFYSSVLLALCTTVCLTGAQVFARASTLLSTVIIASIAMVLASFALKAPFANEERAVYYTGWSVETFMENLWPDLSPISRGQPAETFSTVLGVLFPACIGIMAGASMSSQLRKPSKSIPKGTLWAVLLTFVLYLLVATALGATTRRESLRRNFNILQEINLVPAIVPIGAITTSVTSTLSGLLSAASILQAIAKDDLFALLKPLKVLDRNDSPTRAIVTTYVFSQLAFFVGDTNAVAPFTTMFNLIMFAFVNLACLVLKLAASVNFRPTFRFFKAWTAALGALGCFSTMLFVDMLSALTSTAVVVVLFVYVHYTCPPKPWGDVTQSLIYHQCRKFMLRLDARKDHVKFWRPQILLLVHNPRSSLQLIRFCNALKKGGLYVIGHVIKGEFRSMATELQRQEAAWLQLIDVLRVKAFLNMAVDTEDAAGARSLVFGAGLGGMRPNIVVMGFLNGHAQGCEVTLPTDAIRLNTPISATGYLRIIEDVLTMGKALGIAYGFSRLGPAMPGPAAFAKPTRTKYIDLWPIQVGTATAALSADGQHTYLTNFDSYVMVLQLGTVLHLVPFWNKHYRLRVMCFVEDPGDVDEEYRRVAKLLRDLRVVADLRVHHMRGAGLTTY